MGRDIGPQNRLSRREGNDLFGKGNKLRRLNVPPGQHGPKRQRRQTAYALQLREKQKAKRLYGIREKQFSRYVAEAIKSRGNSGIVLQTLLEKRLDNVLFRLHLAPTRKFSRQIINHSHVLVNAKKMDIPSYQVKVGDVISLRDKILENPDIKELLQEKRPTLPLWLSRKATIGKILRKPKDKDFIEPISVQEVIEFYSR